MKFCQDNVADQAIGQLRVLTQGKRDVFEYGKIRQQGPVLEQHAEALAQLVKTTFVQLRDIDTIDKNSPAVGNQLAGDQSQQGCFPCTARTHYRRHLATRNSDVQAFKNLSLPASVVEIFDLNKIVAAVAHKRIRSFPARRGSPGGVG